MPSRPRERHGIRPSTLSLALAFAAASCAEARQSATCGNGRLDRDEACDPAAPGVENTTWYCSSECEQRAIYVPCTHPGDDCATSDAQCGRPGVDAGAVCLPVSGLGLDETTEAQDDCPALAGPYTQKRFHNLHCVVECAADAECPAQIPHCIDNPFAEASPYEAKRYCVP